MKLGYDQQKTITFYFIFGFYFMIYFGIGIIPANIENLFLTLSGTSELGISILITMILVISMVSMLFFGYYGDFLMDRFTQKNLFIMTNALWIISFGLISLSVNYASFLIFTCIGAIGIGAFLPIGFSMIGDFYPIQKRGTKFGLMQFSLALGNGTGIVIGKVIGWRMGFGLGFMCGLIFLLGYFLLGIIPKENNIEIEGESPEIAEETHYNYKITLAKLREVFTNKSISGILLAVFCSGFAISTLANWGVFYLGLQIDNGSLAVVLYIIAGLGALPGAIIGGYLGDKYQAIDNHRGRIIISFLGLFWGVLFLLMFYTYPFVLFGVLGYFLFSFASGNQFAIYSEVSNSHIKGIVNALNGILLNLGGIIGNIVVSALIQNSVRILFIIIPAMLFIWLIGISFWILPYIFYPEESREYRLILKSMETELINICSVNRSNYS